KHGICVIRSYSSGRCSFHRRVVWQLAQCHVWMTQVSKKWRRSTKRQWHAKTLKPERLEEDFKVFDYELRKEHMEVIKSMDRRYRTNRPAKFRGH
ncbi:unnamed protein product, partial [Brassica napus]